MAVDDLDIYRTAKLLIDQHGDEAPIHSAINSNAIPCDAPTRLLRLAS